MANQTAPAPPFAENDLISKNGLVIVEKLVGCGVDPFLFVIGVPGNLLICMVYRRRGLGDRINAALFLLGVVDLACVTMLFMLGSFCLGETFCRQCNTDWYKWTVRKYFRGGTTDLKITG